MLPVSGILEQDIKMFNYRHSSFTNGRVIWVSVNSIYNSVREHK